MCGKPVHSIDVFSEDEAPSIAGKRYCYMDGFCNSWSCDCNHSGECDCPAIEHDHDAEVDSDGYCYDCTISSMTALPFLAVVDTAPGTLSAHSTGRTDETATDDDSVLDLNGLATHIYSSS